jgi:16S rRNA processing protein RimM
MYIVGHILKPQGIKGEIKVESVSPDTTRFYRLKKIFVQCENLETYLIEAVRISGRFVFLKFSGVNTRNEVEKLRGCEVLIREDDLIDLKDNEYFIHDLIGCRVVDEDGSTIGELKEIMQNPSNDIYVLMAPDGREILIPAISDVVREIDLKTKKIYIRIPEGLLD